MALIPKIQACVKNNCKTLVIRDITGEYDATDNPGGYGAPNIEIGDVTGSSLIITIPGSNTPITIINPVGLPTLDTTFEYEVSTSVLSPIPDGIYKIEYTITAGDITYSYGPRYFFFTCNVECCVAKLHVQIALTTDCSCESNIIKNALYASTLLDGLKANKDCGNITAVNNILNKLTEICGLTGQDCGCSN
jgi:hypothetical protein